MSDYPGLYLLFILVTLIIITLSASLVIFILRHRKRLMQKEYVIKVLKYKNHIELFDASSQAEEREKERIARNLHDEINPMLTLLKQNIQKHKLDLLKNKFEPDHFENDYVLIDKIAEGIRTSAYDLVPSFMLRYGLVNSLADHLCSLNNTDGLKTRFFKYVPDTLDDLFSKPDQLTIYRICLELLQNLIKHAQCSMIDFSMTIIDKALWIEINHNGTIISNNAIEQHIQNGKGLGLKSLKARSLILNAEINYTEKDKQPNVSLTIPFRP